MERTPWVWMPVAVLVLGGLSSEWVVAQQPVPPVVNPPVGGSSGRRGTQRIPAPMPPTSVPPTALPPGSTPPSLESLPPGGGLPPLPGAGPTNPLATGLSLKAAPIEPTDFRFPINLATALRLADARPLIIAAAQAGVWVAEAQLTRAKVLWVPTLNIGFDYTRHDGGGPDLNKGIMTAPSLNLFYGGAGMWGNISTTDAYFAPLVARQVLTAEQWNIQTAKNDVVMQVSDSYFRVHQYRGQYSGALYCVEVGRELVERIANLSGELVPKVEVERARNLLADLEQQATSARQEWRVSSADLTQVLRLDPRAVVEPLEHDHTQITLIDPGRPLDDLMPIALTNRPELGSQQALVQAFMQQIRQEKWRPLLPMVMINGFQTPNEMIQAGIFGLGPNSALNQWAGRVDLSYQPLWQLEAFGLGNLARIKEARGVQSRTIIEFLMTQDGVAADVTRAQARVQSAAARVLQADRAMRTAIITYNGNFEGLKQTMRLGNVLVLVNRPQEAVFALQLLKLAFDDYFATVSEYNRSQFELFHALGYPAREVTALRNPGQVIPVDTARPAYLPPVGNGPPPASR